MAKPYVNFEVLTAAETQELLIECVGHLTVEDLIDALESALNGEDLVQVGSELQTTGEARGEE